MHKIHADLYKAPLNFFKNIYICVTPDTDQFQIYQEVADSVVSVAIANLSDTTTSALASVEQPSSSSTQDPPATFKP